MPPSPSVFPPHEQAQVTDTRTDPSQFLPSHLVPFLLKGDPCALPPARFHINCENLVLDGGGVAILVQHLQPDGTGRFAGYFPAGLFT